MEMIRKYFDLSDDDCRQKINDDTCNDLNVDDVFNVIDYTCSPIGRQYLYKLIRTIANESKFEKLEAWLKGYWSDVDLIARTEKLLGKLHRFESYYLYPMIVRDFMPFGKLVQTALRIMQFLPMILLGLFIITNSSVAIISFILSYILNMCVHFWSKHIAFLHASAVPQLALMIDVAGSLHKTQRFEAVDSQIDDQLKSIKDLRKRLSIFRFNSKFESEFVAIFWIITELVRIFFLIEPINLNSIFIQIKDNRNALCRIFEYVGLIDSLHSVAKLRSEVPDHCLPVFVEDDNSFEATNIYHPLIVDCVKNSFELTDRSFLVMGSNMSGKTTFVRTVGINVLLAQTINTCFADSIRLNRQNIYSAVSVSDSISEGHSYYLSEVLRIKYIIDETQTGANLILLDELFKGTNTIERVAGAKAVLNYLSQNPKNKIIVATHDIELSTLLRDKFATIYFVENIKENELSFEYKIKHEYTNFRNAIKILELYDFPQSVVSDALDVADKYKFGNY